MNNNQSKSNRFLIFCIVLSILITAITTMIERDKKQVEPQPEPEPVVDTVPVPAPEPEPVQEPEPEPEPEPAGEPAETVEETEYVFPAQVHYIAGWDKTLDQLNIDCDVVFMGDSITYKSSFEVEFPDLDICNLSVCSDTIKGLSYRVGTLETVKPEKVFLMIGINSLHNNNLDVCVEDYRNLVDDIRSKGDFELYLMSITPMAKNESGTDDPSPDITVSFNSKIAEIAAEYNATYVDLYSKLVDSGYIKPEYTTDGLHLSSDAYDVWADCIRSYVE